MLTGKNKERFEKWFIKYTEQKIIEGYSYSPFRYFNDLPISMQFGVIQDYADSIGYDVKVYTAHGYFYKWSVRYAVQELANGTSKTRNEARKAALKAFDDVVNGEQGKALEK